METTRIGAYSVDRNLFVGFRCPEAVERTRQDSNR